MDKYTFTFFFLNLGVENKNFVARDCALNILGFGSFDSKIVVITNFHHLPNVTTNLLSIPQLT